MNTEEQKGSQPGAALSADTGVPHILLVENELMIALEIESIIEETGIGKVHIVGNQDAAREALGAAAPAFTAAILDINLSEGDSLGLAQELRERGVPFAFATGYDTSAKFLAEFPNVPVIGKPFDRAELIATVSGLVSPDSGGDPA